MSHQPPPFFKRGPAPLARLTFFVSLSLALLFIDARFQTLELLRQAVSLFTQPIQQSVQIPVRLLLAAGSYFSGITHFKQENVRLQHIELENAAIVLRTRQLESENERLRKLLEIRSRQNVSGQAARILHAARDPFSHRIVVDKGLQNRIVAGQPAIDESGVIGQVTRVFPFVSEITLITDKNQAVPVQIVRNGLRSVVFGLGDGRLELRFMPTGGDVQQGDLLVTSGLDGIFLPGLPVARVVKIERDTSYSFAHISCVPVAGVENNGEVMLLDPREPIDLPAELKDEAGKGGTHAASKKPAAKKRQKAD